MHSFRGIAIWNNGFWFGSPCILLLSTYGIELLTSSALLSTVLACELVTLHKHSWFKYKIKSPGLNRPSLATQLSGSICRTTVPHSSKARASNWIPVREKSIRAGLNHRYAEYHYETGVRILFECLYNPSSGIYPLTKKSFYVVVV